MVTGWNLTFANVVDEPIFHWEDGADSAPYVDRVTLGSSALMPLRSMPLAI